MGWTSGPTTVASCTCGARCSSVATATAPTPRDADGWLATGDGGRVDERGLVHVDGRIGDVIVTGGEKVWPAPVEDAIRSHPAIADAAVAGVPDPEWGQRVVAWVVVQPEADAPSLRELVDHVRASLPPYAAPKELRTADHLPRTAIGKIQRHLLR